MKILHSLLAGIIFYLTAISVIKAENINEREKEYFKSPDYWELTLGDRKDYIESEITKYCENAKINPADLDYVCGITHSLEKVFKDKYWFKGTIGNNINIEMAVNEREAVQLAVIPLKKQPLNDVTLIVSELKNEKNETIPETAINVFNVSYIKTKKAAYPVPFIGSWPDPLVPIHPVDIPSQETRAFWIEVRTSEGTTAGLYRGTVTVCGQNIKSSIITLNVRVWPFSLPKKQVVETCTWISAALKALPEKNPYQLYRDYAEYFLGHKINPLGIGKLFYNRENGDFSKVVDNLDWAFKHGLTRFQIPRLKGEKLKKFCDMLREKEWFNHAMIYGYKDELHPRDYAKFRKDSEQIRKIEPNLKIFMAESPDPGLFGAVDIWWSSMPSDNAKYINKQLMDGKEVWWYRCGIPVRLKYSMPYYYYPSSVLVDRSSIVTRIIYTMIWKFKMTPAAFFYAGFCVNPGKTNKESYEWETGSWLWNGDGFVVYPGPDGPIPSIRLKCMVDGVEDYEYLYILKHKLQNTPGLSDDLRKQAENLLNIPEKLMVNTHYYNRDPFVLLKFRKEVGDLIAKIVSVQSSANINLD